MYEYISGERGQVFGYFALKLQKRILSLWWMYEYISVERDKCLAGANLLKSRENKLNTEPSLCGEF